MSARRWLVLPLLSPLLAVVLVAALNPSPALSFRVLTWVTPRAPLGLWLGGAALGGAALSGVGTALALRQGQGAGQRGRRRVTTATARPWGRSRTQDDDGAWEAFGAQSTPSRREAARQQAWAASAPEDGPGARSWRQATVGVAPPRSPGDPPPTLEVPYRILHRPSQAPSGLEREPVPVSVQDDWGGEAAAEDW